VSHLPPSLARAVNLPRRAGGLSAVEHVVVLVQENRSFDHYFGSLRGVRGIDDSSAVRLRDGRPVFRQRDAAGKEVLPFSARSAALASGRTAEDAQYVGSLPHDNITGHLARAGGWNDGWLTAKSSSTMAYLDRTDLPFHYELADTFTICDAYHCSHLGPTNPNRMYLMTGKIGFEPPPFDVMRAVVNFATDDEDHHPGYSWTTYPERLEDAGVSWRVYHEWENFQCNVLDYFARFKAVMASALSSVDGHQNLHGFYHSVLSGTEPQRERLLAALSMGVAELAPGDRSLFDRGLRRVPPGELITEFRRDVESGQLPQVSYLVPSTADTETPESSAPMVGARFIYRVLDALASTPDIWSSTVVLITYDENDGYFDHVPPPVPPPGTPEGDEVFFGQPLGLGYRVPMLVVSPWSSGGYVCSQTFDHTSVIRLLETWLDVKEPQISPWRRQVCGDLTSALGFDEPTPLVALRPPHVEPQVPTWRAAWYPQPPESSTLPSQEPGRRPSRPLPYQPDAWCRLESPDALSVTLTNVGAASAHFAVYPYRELAADQPTQHDVEHLPATQRFLLDGNHYEVAVHGPNRFLRLCAGEAVGAAAQLHVFSRIDARERLIRIVLDNAGDTDLACVVSADIEGPSPREQRLEVPAGSTRNLAWWTAPRDGWYDLTITAEQDTSFVRRLVGHIENGRPTATPDSPLTSPTLTHPWSAEP
jgi:phospholipase C